jgi:hypothetical protein
MNPRQHLDRVSFSAGRREYSISDKLCNGFEDQSNLGLNPGCRRFVFRLRKTNSSAPHSFLANTTLIFYEYREFFRETPFATDSPRCLSVSGESMANSRYSEQSDHFSILHRLHHRVIGRACNVTAAATISNSAWRGFHWRPGVYRSVISILFGITFLFFSGEAPAVEIVPFFTFNQSPLVQIHGLPSIDNASLVSVGRVEGIVSVDAANNFAIDSNSTESITLDGETYRFVLAARYGVAKGFECGIDIPYVVHSGGFLDGFIESFHHFFGFPNGGRESAPRDRLLYRYTTDYADKVDLSDSTSGLGDIRLSGAMQLYREDSEAPFAAALRASLKLPTGDSNRLLGSGSTDFALWITASENYRLPALGHLTGFGAIGGMVMGDGDVLKGQQRNLAGFGSLGIGWSPLNWLALKVQANGHTSLYQDSDLREVNRGSVQLVSGGTFGFTKDTTLDIGVSEDIIVETSPDVVFTLTLRTLF